MKGWDEETETIAQVLCDWDEDSQQQNWHYEIAANKRNDKRVLVNQTNFYKG